MGKIIEIGNCAIRVESWTKPCEIVERIVREYAYQHLDKSDGVEYCSISTYTVWFCYILGGWKALVSTTLPDGMYYEVTYDKDTDEIYLDAYKKFDNREFEIHHEF